MVAKRGSNAVLNRRGTQVALQRAHGFSLSSIPSRLALLQYVECIRDARTSFKCLSAMDPLAEVVSFVHSPPER